MSFENILKQYTDLQAEIRDLEIRIQKLEIQVDKIEHDFVKGSHSEFPYTPKTFHIQGINVKKQQRVKRLKKLLSKRRDKCEELKLKIEKFISDIPNSRTRRVFQYRYVDGLTWQAIARRIGKHDESYPRKIVHDKYLEGLEGRC